MRAPSTPAKLIDSRLVRAQGNVAHFVAVRAAVVVDPSMTKVAPAW